MLKNAANLTAVLSLAGMFLAAYIYIDARYARTSELEKLESRLQALDATLALKVKSDYLREVQERIWRLEDELGQREDDPALRHELRRLHEEKKRLDEEIRTLRLSPGGRSPNHEE